MYKFTLLVAEDTFLEMELIKGLLEKNFKTKIDWTKSEFARSHAATVDILQTGQCFDITLLDRNLGDIEDSFSLIKRFKSQLGFVAVNSIDEKNKKTIQELSNYLPYSDKLTKPYREAKFVQEMTVIFAQCNSWIKERDYLLANEGQDIIPVPKNSIIYISVESDTITYHYEQNGQLITASQTQLPLKKHAALLDSKKFRPINRNTIVNFDHVVNYSFDKTKLTLRIPGGTLSFDVTRKL